MKKLMVLADSPTVHTGFGRVAQNLLKRWRPEFDQIDVWAINYTGHPHPLQHDYRLYPAGTGDWSSAENLAAFLRRLAVGGYTHVFLLQDTFQLSQRNFPAGLQRVCTEKNIRSVYYFPVDAALEPEWTEILTAVDVAVAYTEYGRNEAKKALSTLLGHHAFKKAVADKRLKAGASLDGFLKTVTLNMPKIEVIPHGVDTAVYHPLPDHAAVRKGLLNGIQDDELLLVNVNANQRRKDMPRSLELLAALKRRGLKCRLVMHCSNPSTDGIDLELVGEQLGLVYEQDWLHNGHMFAGNRPNVPEAEMNRMYNAADLVISTSLGEGWGLSITEALAAGCPMAAPDHTSCAEIWERVMGPMGGQRIVKLPIETNGVVNTYDNSRLRYRVDVELAADRLMNYISAPLFKERPELVPELRDWLSWDRIAAEFLKLMGVEQQPVAAVPPAVVKHAVLCEQNVQELQPTQP